LNLRVDLSDGRRTLVLEGGDGGADEELQYGDVAQDLDPSPEGPRTTLPAKASPGASNLVFKFLLLNYLWMLVHLSSGVVWNLRCMIPRYLCPY
jgi:hypothetical protein